MATSAFDRAAEDERNGDLGSARRRLMSLLRTQGYDAAVVEAIARYCVRMQDLREAGRWYYMCGSSDSQAAGAIELFSRSCGGDARQIAAQLPLQRMFREPAAIPDVVRQRLDACGQTWLVPSEAQRIRTAPRGWRSTAESRLYAIGCAVLFFTLAILVLVGLVTVIGRFVK